MSYIEWIRYTAEDQSLNYIIELLQLLLWLTIIIIIIIIIILLISRSMDLWR